MPEQPTLLMIHGLVGSLDYFDPQARLPQITVITADLLGYGRHRAVPASELTLAAQAEHVVRCIDRYPAEQVWLLGHSVGAAVAVLAARRRAARIRGLINVEGNFTEKDAFWSSRIAGRSADEWVERYRNMERDVSGWLVRCGVEPNPQRIAWAAQILAHQPASTVYAMSQAVLDETLAPAYLETVRRLIDGGLPLHLVAGEKSAAAWDVPAFVRRAATSCTEQPGVGHLMMLEAPDAFCEIVGGTILRFGRPG